MSTLLYIVVLVIPFYSFLLACLISHSCLSSLLFLVDVSLVHSHVLFAAPYFAIVFLFLSCRIISFSLIILAVRYCSLRCSHVTTLVLLTSLLGSIVSLVDSFLLLLLLLEFSNRCRRGFCRSLPLCAHCPLLSYSSCVPRTFISITLYFSAFCSPLSRYPPCIPCILFS